MSTAPSPVPSSGPARPVQKFRPTAGPGIGYLVLAVCAIVVGLVATSDPGVLGLQVVLGAVMVAVVIWLVLLRPRATAYDDTLVLRGMVSDTTLPLAAIDAAVVRTMLVVWIGENRYTCAGIARSKRSMVRRPGPGAVPMLGLRHPDAGTAVGSGGHVGASADYPTFVETRIEDLARSARRDGRSAPAVTRRWARLELTALGVSVLAFLASLLVL